MAAQKSGEDTGTSSDTSQSVQDTASQSFFGNIIQRIRNLRGRQQSRTSTSSERSLSSRSSGTEDVKQSIEGETSRGEEYVYYQLYKEAKTERERQHKRADKYEQAWKLSEDSVRQLQEEARQKDLWVRDVEQRTLKREENMQRLSEERNQVENQMEIEGQKNRDLVAVVKMRDNEIIVLLKRIQDLHEELDEEIAKRTATEIQDGGENPLGAAQIPELNETGQANTRQTDMVTEVAGNSPNGDMKMGEMSQMMTTMMKLLEEERKLEREERERDRNYENPAKVRKDMKLELNTALLTEGNYKGLKHLNEWIKEVELWTNSDKARVQMIKLAAQPSVLELLGIEKKNLPKMTWEELKKLLVDNIPELDPWKAARHLMDKPMTADDNILAFAANLKEEYKNICRATGKEDIQPGYNNILAAAILGNMDFKAKWTYSNSIITDPNGTIKEMAKFFNQSEDYKRSLFVNPSTPGSTGGQQTATTQYGTGSYGVQHVTLSAVQPTYPTIPTSGNKATQMTYVSGMEGNQRDDPTMRQNNFRTGSHNNEGNGNRSPISERRMICFRQWNDWKCVACLSRNPATWYTCNKESCHGQATERQIPPNSWQCQPSCGQTNWEGDHYCNGCLGPNPHISPDQLRHKSDDLRPRPRHKQRWFSRPPVLEP